MRFLGIDPGLSITGYACVEIADALIAPGRASPTALKTELPVRSAQHTGSVISSTFAGAPHDIALIEAGVLRLRSSEPMAYRLAQLHEDLLALIDELHPQVAVVEMIFTHYRHARTGILMGHARGVVLLAMQQRGVELAELLPTEVKKAITGNGHASKQQVQMAVMGQCGLAAPPSPPDVADAIAIALCAARRRANGTADEGE